MGSERDLSLWSGATIVVVGALVSCLLSAAMWDRKRQVRPLPLYFFLAVGVTEGVRELGSGEPVRALEKFLVSVTIGAVVYGFVWLQRR